MRGRECITRCKRRRSVLAMNDPKTVAGDFSSFAPTPGPGGDGESAARSTPTAGGIRPPMPARYPGPARSPEYNRRVAIHEGAGHAFLSPRLVTELESVRI